MARGDLNASKTGTATRGNALSDREIEAAIIRVLGTKFGLTERVIQRLQELIGERAGPGSTDKPLSAVRRDDLGVLARMDTLKSKAIGGAPTAADFNALRDDLRQVYEALGEISSAVRGAPR